MGIKIAIVILFIGVVISLFTGLTFLVKDQGDGKKRQWYALGARVVLTASLLGTIFYGIQSGKLQFGAPWDAYKNESEVGR
ncbi:MAG TPA: DUF2909 domain-containing protein [Spongiibacteraceae bacterium]|nr:hypothetical protein [Spongiibacteraceae bacterium]HCS28384.1 DUF2909 domain-containing protein [Spongiibacteraceae bacterium]|tara:strand:- start:2080 stop:2322 length:243 start_codon:yes stop_codon:yes gene_type:complete